MRVEERGERRRKGSGERGGGGREMGREEGERRGGREVGRGRGREEGTGSGEGSGERGGGGGERVEILAPFFCSVPPQKRLECVKTFNSPGRDPSVSTKLLSSIRIEIKSLFARVNNELHVI